MAAGILVAGALPAATEALITECLETRDYDILEWRYLGTITYPSDGVVMELFMDTFVFPVELYWNGRD